MTARRASVPHVIPYQGSKRRLADDILRYVPNHVERLIEPFCGSAAVSLAVAARFPEVDLLLNDSHPALMALWEAVMTSPSELAAAYERHWTAQQGREQDYYIGVRQAFNSDPTADRLLFLLARCAKAAVRYNRDGAFNQSADQRRKGARPSTTRRRIDCVSALLRGRVRLSCADYADIVREAGPNDVVYMDPPYQGARGASSRYEPGFDHERFCVALRALNDAGTAYLVSYDGPAHGSRLPDDLDLTCVRLRAGRSAQGTLLGRSVETVESLYVSRSVARRLGLP